MPTRTTPASCLATPRPRHACTPHSPVRRVAPHRTHVRHVRAFREPHRLPAAFIVAATRASHTHMAARRTGSCVHAQSRDRHR
ncbi:hypothetical protein E2562_016506 [Oryza meyeriana var. granulata]|uniref:Uncharacterized protein n=1 Tax=Oryza meyeriana var. granulata TaxID=110450 RepID=A0A6G1C6W5_9ORYZ|nr:hypothetical protein E2562_016506 [Oryza meyeriana var. granulata]